jgi:hypothetical protein
MGGAAKLSSTTLTVEHVTITSTWSFEQVRRKLEALLPRLDERIVAALSTGDADAARTYDESGPALSIFLERDHGALLRSVGQKRNAIQYEIGNPLTASKMTRYKLPAALYAPLRVVLYADAAGNAVFEYDKPSSLFGQFGDSQVTDVGRGLDIALETALRAAAE